MWDGINKLQGELILEEKSLKFHLFDFANTDLEFEIMYNEISNVDIHSLFGLDEQGVEIISKSRKSNVFVVDNPMRLKKEILERMKIKE